MNSQPALRPTVFIVDDDASVRDSLELLIQHEGWNAVAFSTARSFQEYLRVDSPRCLILDVTLPDFNGLELQKRLAQDQTFMPIIFITGYGDVPTTVSAMKAGAFEFLTKPFDTDELLDAVRRALMRSHEALVEYAELKALFDRYDSLTSREREVMRLVVSGRLNKQIAHELGISEITVKAHRGRLMRKMAAESLADLVKMEPRLKSEVPAKSSRP